MDRPKRRKKPAPQAVAAPAVTGNEHCCAAQYWAVAETKGTLSSRK
jgi:hypothetical protein